MAEFPKKAKVVIIGVGGIVGASIAHHLIERGWNDIVGIDKSGIPTDIGSTAHASDFCYTTAHDFLSCWTTLYSIDFYEKLGHYSRVGGLEIARVGDDARMDEIKRKVASAKSFGTRARLIGPAEIKKKFPLIEEDLVQGGMWDPDAGLVIPRSQTVAGKLVDQAEASGKLQAFANTPVKSLVDREGAHQGRGDAIAAPSRPIMSSSAAGLWGRLIAEMAGEDLPVMPVDHPLTFFGPYNEFAGTGKEIGWPLLRDQGNSAYMRDTGDPKTAEGGQIEWGYYEETNPRLCHPRDILEKNEARLSPSQRDLQMEQIMEPLERAIELTPILGELGYNESHSFNGLLQVTTDGGPSIGESQKVRGLWYAVAIWVKDAPGMAKLRRRLDDRWAHRDRSREASTIRASIRIRWRRTFIEGRCGEAAQKVYNPAVHPREPYATGRNLRRSPFYEREKALGGYFMELGGWERAHGYASNEHLLKKYGNRVPLRENEWDNRHFWRVSNAEHLAMSEDCGIVNLSHFAMYRCRGPGPCRADGMALRRQDRRRRQYRQGHLHPLPRRRRHGARRLDRLPHGRPLPRGRWRRCRPARFPLHAPRGPGQGLRRHRHRRDGEVHHHRHLGPECPRDAAEGGRGSGRPRRRRTSPSPPSSRSGSPARMSPPSAFPMSASRAGNCICSMRTASPSGMRCARPASCPSASRPMPIRGAWRRACACRTRIF